MTVDMFLILILDLPSARFQSNSRKIHILPVRLIAMFQYTKCLPGADNPDAICLNNEMA
jgi:hypothetical protein